MKTPSLATVSAVTVPRGGTLVERLKLANASIDSHVKNLRRKIQAVDPSFDWICSIYGVGYCFDSPSATDQANPRNEL